MTTLHVDNSNHTSTHCAVYVPIWTSYGGTKLWRVPGSDFVAVPAIPGDRRCVAFDIVNLQNPFHVEAQLLREDVHEYLCHTADLEGCTPDHMMERFAGKIVPMSEYIPTESVSMYPRNRYDNIGHNWLGYPWHSEIIKGERTV